MTREILLADSGHINIGKAFDWIVTELNENIQWLFDFITTVLSWCIDNLTTALDFSVDLPGSAVTLPGDAGTIALLPDHTVVILILAALAWLVRSWQFALFSVIALWVLDNMELWSEAASSLSLVIVASVIIIIVAIPLGVAAAKSQRVSQVVRPVLDFMQTLPPFVYLIPGIFFFGLGTVPGVVATVVFAMAPGVRLTELGIRQVDPEMVEAGEAFGATPRSILFRIQFPLALPTVMAGINQIIMLSLSMVVIAGMVGAGGLGGTVYEAISHVDIAAGFEGGLGVVILAIYLDRLTSALTNRSAVARAERVAAQSN